MKICIIGGGTSGWWTAGYLEKKLNAKVTLYESANIPIIGVGESTLPQVKYFFEDLEIDESEWFNECKAVHKFGNKKYQTEYIISLNKKTFGVFISNYKDINFDNYIRLI